MIAVVISILLGFLVGSPATAELLVRLTVIEGPAPALPELRPSCLEGRDLPDAPARAIHLAGGTVELYATDRDNRVNAGPDLLHLEHRCPVVFRGGGNDDPAAFDDRAWIASPWTPDGLTVWAIVHNEFQGHLRPSLCPTRQYMDCWFNTLILAVSHDGGARFERAPGRALVAALPYRFDQVGIGHHGYFNPSNIVRFDGALNMFAFATQVQAQRNGNCLLRTDAIETSGAWRGWDGTRFSVEFVDPYTRPVKPEQHVCSPVDVDHLRWPVTSLVRHARTGLFIATMQDTQPGGGVFYATSPDLLHWSGPFLLMRSASLASWKCGDPNPIAYPSLLDPVSRDINFETIGDHALLFATVFQSDSCNAKPSRVLMRWQITVGGPE